MSPDPVQRMDADVNRKLKLYEIIQAFRAGRLPDNAQIDSALKWAIAPEHSPVELNNLSQLGQKLVRDVRDILETVRVIIQEKNSDELLQNFVFNTSDLHFTAESLAGSSIPHPQEETKSDSKRAVKHIRSLVQLILTNAEARKLLSDLSLILRDLLATGAVAVANRIRPDSLELAQVDDTAITEAELGIEESLSVTMKAVAREIKDAAFGRDDEVYFDAHEPGVTSPDTEENQTLVSPSETTSKEEKKPRSGMVFRRDKHKLISNNQITKAGRFLEQHYFPRERQDRLIWRTKKILVECQNHQKYKEALEWFLDTVNIYFTHSKGAIAVGANQGRDFLSSDPLFQEVIYELRILLERFANGVSMSSLLDTISRFRDEVQEDETLSGWWSRVYAFASKALLEPGFILGPRFDSTLSALMQDATRLFIGKYKGHKDEFLAAVSFFLQSFADDALNKRIAGNLDTLTRDILLDVDGRVTYKPQLWDDVRTELLPKFMGQLAYLPIPRIEYTDADVDFVVENLTLQGKQLLPKVFHININNDIKLFVDSDIRAEQQHTIKLALAEIQAEIRDVAFFYRRKTGLTKWKDAGLADVSIGGQGISVTIEVQSQGLDDTDVEINGRILKVKEVKVKIHDLAFSIRGSRHDLLYKTIKPIATRLIKKQISKALADAFTTGVELVDTQLMRVREKVSSVDSVSNRAPQKLHSGPLHHQRTTQSKGLVKEGSRFKIVPKQQSMILPDIGYEKGWIKRQSDLIRNVSFGEKWRSPAFSLTNP